MNPTLRRLKSVVIVVLVLFAAMSLRLNLLAAAEKELTIASKFQNLLKDTEKLLEEIAADLMVDKDVSAKLNQLKQVGHNLHSLAGQLGAEFNKTRAKLKSKKVPSEILKRHDNFVQKFEDNLDALLSNLNEAEKAKIEKIKEKVRADKDNLKENIKKKKNKNQY